MRGRVGHQDGNRNLIIITLCMVNAVHLNQLKNIYKSISKVVLCCSSTDELETEYRGMSGECVTLSSSWWLGLFRKSIFERPESVTDVWKFGKIWIFTPTRVTLLPDEPPSHCQFSRLNKNASYQFVYDELLRFCFRLQLQDVQRSHLCKEMGSVFLFVFNLKT